MIALVSRRNRVFPAHFDNKQEYIDHFRFMKICLGKQNVLCVRSTKTFVVPTNRIRVTL